MSANYVTSLQYMYMVSTSPSMLCYEPSPRMSWDWLSLLTSVKTRTSINSPIHIYCSLMLHYIILIYMMYKVLPCSNHHSFLPIDCAPGTQSTRWVAVTQWIWRTWWLIWTLPRVVSTLQCLTVLVWTNLRLTPQGLDNCFNQVPWSDPKPVRSTNQSNQNYF